MDLRHLETLLAIQDTGSFTGAADRLHTVQSNVSDQIRQLEDELGVTLFTRGRRGAVPTVRPGGRRTLPPGTAARRGATGSPGVRRVAAAGLSAARHSRNRTKRHGGERARRDRG